MSVHRKFRRWREHLDFKWGCPEGPYAGDFEPRCAGPLTYLLGSQGACVVGVI